tara:strand:- start:194 stop:520 length:327 start_codon:yes stop_codon:yes gene_type:complete
MLKKEYIQLIQQLSFQFAKYHYDLYVKEQNIKFISHDAVPSVVDTMYTQQRKKELFSFLRQMLKQQFGDDYNPMLVEPILEEISQDDSLGKQRIVTEIHDFQKQYYFK